MRFRMLLCVALLATLALAQERAPLNRAELYKLKTSGVSEQRILKLVDENGINFEPTDESLQALKDAGATQVLLGGLKEARLKEHVANAKRLDADGKHADAQAEWRLALALSPSNGALHLGLGESYRAAGQLDDAVRELDIASATEPGAEDELRVVRTQAEQQRHEQAEQSQRLHEQQAAEATRALEIRRTTGLAGRWMSAANHDFTYTVTVTGTTWQADLELPPKNGILRYKGTMNGNSITGTRVRQFRDDACHHDLVFTGNMSATVSGDGNSILMTSQDPRFKSTGLLGCGTQITGYDTETITLVRIP